MAIKKNFATSVSRKVGDTTTRKFLEPNSVVNPISDMSSDTKTYGSTVSLAASSLKSSAIAVSNLSKISKSALDEARKQTFNAKEFIVSVVDNQTIINFRDSLTNSVDSNSDNVANSSKDFLENSYGRNIKDILNSNFLSRLSDMTDSLLPKREQASKSSNNVFIEIESASTSFDKVTGVIDGFYSSIIVNVSLKDIQNSDKPIIRLHRTKLPVPNNVRKSSKLSLNALEILRTNSKSTRNNFSNGEVSFFDRKQDGSSAESVRTSNIALDQSVGQGLRKSNDDSTSALTTNDDSTQLNSFQLEIAKNDAKSFPLLGANFSQDRSVTRDLNFISNAISAATNKQIISNTLVGKGSYVSNANMLGDEHVRQNRKNYSDTSSDYFSMVSQNDFGFEVIAQYDVDLKNSKKIGDLLTLELTDESILFGCSYIYFVTIIKNGSSESKRSNLVSINVDGLRIPACPSSLILSKEASKSILLSISNEDGFVEKFEVYRKDTTASKSVIRAQDYSELSVISGKDGTPISSEIRPSLGNGFSQVGECDCRGLSGAIFRDTNVVPGRGYEYRVYSVDIFGNKSERPAIAYQFLGDASGKQNDLINPSIVTRIDDITGRIAVTLSCPDNRVVKLKLSRKDLTTNSDSFVVPDSVSRIKLGNYPVGRDSAHETQRIFNKEENLSLRWNGYFDNNHNIQIEFIDLSTTIDRTYQYSVEGIDKFGNKTSSAVTSHIFVPNRDRINKPVAVTPSLRFQGGYLKSIDIKWRNGSEDKTSEDLLGSQNKLSDTAIRTLYQVERKKMGEEIWKQFPMTSNLSFSDYLDTAASASYSNEEKFRPEYVILNESYAYRIAAYQSGGFISSYTTPVTVEARQPIFNPENFKCIPADSKIRPYYVMLNWDTNILSDVVDMWEIQRAEINNIAAAQISVVNNLNASEFPFVEFRMVYRESSRFRSRSEDIITDASSENLDILASVNHFMDMNVAFGNTYIYRIRAISSSNSKKSNWVYSSVKLTSAPFENKISVLVSDEEKRDLISTYDPFRMKSDYVPTNPTSDYNSSFSLIADAFKVVSYSPEESIDIVRMSTVATPEQTVQDAIIDAQSTVIQDTLSYAETTMSTVIIPVEQVTLIEMSTLVQSSPTVQDAIIEAQTTVVTPIEPVIIAPETVYVAPIEPIVTQTSTYVAPTTSTTIVRSSYIRR